MVHRPRLIERLEKNLAKRVTLIIAAAGYGKTTLAAQWLAHSQRNVAWLSLNPFDRDQERFLNYVIAAIRAAVQEFGVSIEPLLESPIMPPPEYLAEALVVDIAALKKPLIYVVDFLMDEVISRQPDEIKVFLATTAMLERFCAPLCDAILTGD
jgi:LuxR family maltose regulon positive regulatory protein